MLDSIVKKLKERFPPEKITFENFVLKKEVPIHKSSWIYYLGGITMFCFLVQIITGLLLLPYYQPTIVNAYQSIEYLNYFVPNGFLVRNLHAWAGSFMIFFAIIHLLTVFATKSYEKPRELTWTSGVLLLLITLAFGFTGYLLPWHQIAVNATKVAMEILQSSTSFLPGIFRYPGKFLAYTISGGPIITQTTLSRFFALHVVILPFIFFGLVALHLFLVQLHGMNKESFRVEKYEKFFPNFFIKDLAVWLFLFLILLIISQALPYDSFLSYPLKAPYIENSATPSGIKPEWYFLFLYYPLEVLPKTFVILTSLIILITITLTPRLFRRLSVKVHTMIAIFVFVYLLVSTVWGGDIVQIIRK